MSGELPIWFPLYVLDDARRGVPGSMDEWVAIRMDFDNRCRVGWTQLGDHEVSTVFLGVDHSHGIGTVRDDGLGSGRSSVGGHYATWKEAEAGHKAVVERIEREKR
jgi:hypothetical protein